MYNKNKKIMGANSKHYGDVSKWIEKIIESCTTVEQTQTAQRVIDSFDKSLRGIDYYLKSELRRKLQIQLDYKFDQCITNIINKNDQ